MYFYSRDYEKAAKNFERSLKLKEDYLNITMDYGN